MKSDIDRMQNMEQAYHRVKTQRDNYRQQVEELQARINWLEKHVPKDSDATFFATEQEYNEFQGFIMPDFYSRVG